MITSCVGKHYKLPLQSNFDCKIGTLFSIPGRLEISVFIELVYGTCQVNHRWLAIYSGVMDLTAAKQAAMPPNYL